MYTACEELDEVHDVGEALVHGAEAPSPVDGFRLTPGAAHDRRRLRRRIIPHLTSINSRKRKTWESVWCHGNGCDSRRRNVHHCTQTPTTTTRFDDMHGAKIPTPRTGRYMPRVPQERTQLISFSGGVSRKVNAWVQFMFGLRHGNILNIIQHQHFDNL